jgi:RHS repeat-associated protein
LTTGATSNSARYLPFGGTRWESGATPTDFQFTGQRKETGFGLYDYNARYYDPLIGRFVSADSVVPGAGKPQSLNRYAYVYNNPLKYVDPSGHVAAADDIDAGCTDSACRRPLIQLYALYGAKVDNGLLESVPGGEQWYTAHISEWDGAYGSYYNEHGERFDYQPSTGEHMALGYAQYSKTGVNSILMQFVWQAVAEAPMVYAAAVQTHKASAGGRAVRIEISKSEYPEAAQHIEDAQAAGHPSVLTVDRKGAYARRQQSLKGHSTVSGLDRDEYPPAMFKEGGKGASVKPINIHDNRGAGSCLGNACGGLSDGTHVKIVVVP